MLDLATWLRRRRPDRIVCRPSGETYPRPAKRPWSALADLAAGSATVEAWAGETLIAIYRAEAVPSAATTSAAATSAAAAAPATTSPTAAAPFAAELAALREIVKTQGEVFRSVVQSQQVAIRAMRQAARLGPRDDDDDDDAGHNAPDDEDAKLVRDLLRRNGIEVPDGADPLPYILRVAGAPKESPQ